MNELKKLFARPKKLDGAAIVFTKAVVAALVELSVDNGVGIIGLAVNVAVLVTSNVESIETGLLAVIIAVVAPVGIISRQEPKSTYA